MSRFQEWENRSRSKIVTKFSEPESSTVSPSVVRPIEDNAISRSALLKREWEKERVRQLIDKHDAAASAIKSDYVSFKNTTEYDDVDISNAADQVIQDTLFSNLEIIKEKPSQDPEVKKFIDDLNKITEERAETRNAARAEIISKLKERNNSQEDNALAFDFDSTSRGVGRYEADVIDELMDHELCIKLGVKPMKEMSDELKAFKSRNEEILDRELSRNTFQRNDTNREIRRRIDRNDKGLDTKKKFGYVDPEEKDNYLSFQAQTRL